MNRLALSYQQAGYPATDGWTFDAPSNERTLPELRGWGLVEQVDSARPRMTTWRLTDAGQRWVMAHVQF